MPTNLTDLAVDLVPCDYCQARPGDSCVVAAGHRTAGRRASYTHTARTTIAYQAWRVGYSEGLTEAVATIRRATGASEGRPGVPDLDEALARLERWAAS
jgi:hypothetical protein